MKKEADDKRRTVSISIAYLCVRSVVEIWDADVMYKYVEYIVISFKSTLFNTNSYRIGMQVKK